MANHMVEVAKMLGVDPGERFKIIDNQTGCELLHSCYFSYEGIAAVANEGCSGPGFMENGIYRSANYYSDISVAQNNARADKLMRQLRRFAVEHREHEIDWNDDSRKYCIYDEGNTNNLKIDYCFRTRYPGCIYFDTPEAARLAIETFKDELIWYFTEYKDSL